MVRLKNIFVKHCSHSSKSLSKCFSQCTTMKRRLHFRRCIDKTYKKLVKLNLSNVFNSTITKPMKYIKNEFQNMYKEKIKSDYHYTPKIMCQTIPQQYLPLTSLIGNTNTHQPEVQLQNNIPTTADVKKNCIELAFNYMQTPTLRDKIEEIFETMITHNKENSFSNDDSLCDTSNNDLSSLSIELDNPYQIINMSAGRYLHIGIISQIKNIYSNVFAYSTEKLYLTIGMYVMKSATLTGLNIPRYLVIYGHIKDTYNTTTLTKKKSFIIGIYQGTFPVPTIANEILRPFVDEMKEIQTQNVYLDNIHAAAAERYRNNDLSFSSSLSSSTASSSLFVASLPAKIHLHSFVVDPIANSLLTCTSLPNGIFGCSKCRQKGHLEFNNELTSFPPYCKSEYYRSDDDFKYCLDTNYHFGVPIINELNIGLISQIVIDYRNTIIFGCMRRLMDLWLNGKLDYRLNKEAIKKIDYQLSMIKCPKEFSQLTPKKLSDHEQWTAYDWKQFLLYYGPIVLKDNLSNKFYLNFLLLHMGARIMLNPGEHNKCSAFISGILVKKFLIEFTLYYGSDLVDYNFHNLLHFEDTINAYGSLENVSGFLFENEINFMKNIVNTKDNIELEKISDMLSNSSIIINDDHDDTLMKSKKFNEPFLDDKYNLYYKNFIFNNSEPNNYVLTKRGPIKICGIYMDDKINEICIIGQKFQNRLILYEIPMSDQNLTLVTGLNEFEMFKLSDIITKAMAFESNCGLYILPVLTQ